MPRTRDFRCEICKGNSSGRTRYDAGKKRWGTRCEYDPLCPRALISDDLWVERARQAFLFMKERGYSDEDALVFVNTIAVPDATIGYILPHTMCLLQQFLPDTMKQIYKNTPIAEHTKAGDTEDTDARDPPPTPKAAIVPGACQRARACDCRSADHGQCC